MDGERGRCRLEWQGRRLNQLKKKFDAAYAQDHQVITIQLLRVACEWRAGDACANVCRRCES